MTLPYEPVCTENLTPWLRLLPCRGDAGLGSLLVDPELILKMARSSFFSLKLAASRKGGFLASLSVVLEGPDLEEVLGVTLPRGRPRANKNAGGEDLLTSSGAGQGLQDTGRNDLEHNGMSMTTINVPGSASSSFATPRSGSCPIRGQELLLKIVVVHGSNNPPKPNPNANFEDFRGSPEAHLVQTPGHNVDVQRDILPDVEGNVRSYGIWRAAIDYLQLRTEPRGQRRGQLVFRFVVTDPRAIITVKLVKRFVHIDDFSFAAEKGFDLGSAAYVLSTSSSCEQKMFLTDGTIVMVQMPDFSMPFNINFYPSNMSDSDSEEEYAAIAAWVRKHPCPLEDKVEKWLENAVSGDDDDNRLRGVLVNTLNIGSTEAMEYFDYGLFKKLWEAPLADGRKAEQEAQHEVGVALNKKGGIACMRQHYYMINYAMCDAVFYPASERRPRILYFYVNLMSSVWSGIGEWLK
eukprot:g14962.t1